MKPITTFFVGLAIGAIGGYFTAVKLLEKHYMDLTRDETDDDLNTYKEGCDSDDIIIQGITPPHFNNYPRTYQCVLAEYGPDEEGYTDEADADSAAELEDEELTPTRITKTEFEQNNTYEKAKLFYSFANEYLFDEAACEFTGFDAEVISVYLDDIDQDYPYIYVRFDALGSDYEIEVIDAPSGAEESVKNE